MAMFPDLALQIDDIYWMGNDDEGYLVSVRWSILRERIAAMEFMVRQRVAGSICGASRSIRSPTAKIKAEWMLFNEFAVMQQIFRD